jgi:hypothetical protein
VDRAQDVPVGDRVALEEWWSHANVHDQRAIARQALARVVILRRGKGFGTFDPSRVVIEYGTENFRANTSTTASTHGDG